MYLKPAHYIQLFFLIIIYRGSTEEKLCPLCLSECFCLVQRPPEKIGVILVSNPPSPTLSHFLSSSSSSCSLHCRILQKNARRASLLSIRSFPGERREGGAILSFNLLHCYSVQKCISSVNKIPLS